MVYVLGITHPISWNTAAVLLEDGHVIAAVEEERFVRIKHAPRMIPHNAIEFVLQKAGIKYNDVDMIAVSWNGPHDVSSINDTIKKISFTDSEQVAEKAFWTVSIEKEILLIKYLQKRFIASKIFFVDHHISHAASACYVSGFDNSLFLTLDGRGEFESGLMGIYQNGEMEVVRRFGLSESLGNMYSNFTSLIGYRGHTDEGKVMGLAPYGKPMEYLFDIANVKEGRIKIDWKKIDHLRDNNKFQGDDPTKDERKDFAATIQHILEKCVLQLVSDLSSISNTTNICLAGGCALNIDMNGSILKSGLVKDIFVQPAAHDAGCALGAALHIYHQHSSKSSFKMKHAFLGPQWQNGEIKEFLENAGLKHELLDDTPSEIAELLSKNKIIGWFQGSSEFGPRALGSRSILANPTEAHMWSRVNQVKGREYWRPLAPSIVEEDAEKFFASHNTKSPFMLLRFDVKEEKIHEIPATVHVDKTARPQTVSKETNVTYWNLLKEFEKIKGVPLLINTSFNLRGEPIVNSPQDAVKTFYNSDIDYLCVGEYLVHK